MSRLLIIPAAGLGSRLQADAPKVLVPVAGRTMLDRLVHLYAAAIDRFVVIVHPSFAERVRAHCRALPAVIEFELQPEPTGMLDAILLARGRVSSFDTHVWITWCDQVAVHPLTVARLATLSTEHPTPLILPTAHRRHPYIHLERDETGRILRVLHRREGDALPEVGESEMGLFSLTREAYLDQLTEFAASSGRGALTGERNFLPFIPWIAERGEVLTFPCVEEVEAVGINTPEELRLVEDYLAARDAERAD